MKHPIPANAYILAGGESRRFGSDKALQDWNGKPLIQHMVDTLAPWFDALTVVARSGKHDDRLVDAPIVRDQFENCGPLGGIHAALAASQSDWNFIIACDMPLAQRAVVALLWSKHDEPISAVVPEIDRQLLPTFGFYHRNVLNSVVQFLRDDQRTAYKWVKSLPHAVVPEATLRRVDAHLQSFINLNTLDARRRALRFLNTNDKGKR